MDTNEFAFSPKSGYGVVAYLPRSPGLFSCQSKATLREDQYFHDGDVIDPWLNISGQSLRVWNENDEHEMEIYNPPFKNIRGS